jgi:hypothetical protein
MIQETQETVNIPESPRNCWMNKWMVYMLLLRCPAQPGNAASSHN